MKKTTWALALCSTILAIPAWAQKMKPKEVRTDVPLAHLEIQDTFSNRITTFSNGCRMRYSSWSLPTLVSNCGRYDGRYSAWAWGGNELRFVGRQGQQKSFYFFRRSNGQIYATDNDGVRWDVTSIN